MHELSITENILQIATVEAQRASASQIKVIRIRVGALTDIVPESVQFYMDVLSRGTMADGAKLEATIIPIGATCKGCGAFFLVQNFDLTCPKCGSMAKITQGRELSVESLEVEN